MAGLRLLVALPVLFVALVSLVDGILIDHTGLFSDKPPTIGGLLQLRPFPQRPRLSDPSCKTGAEDHQTPMLAVYINRPADSLNVLMPKNPTARSPVCVPIWAKPVRAHLHTLLSLAEYILITQTGHF